jgi:DnaJ family protein C protein 13
VCHGEFHAMDLCLCLTLFACVSVLPAAAPLGSEDFFLTNSREDNYLAKTAKLLAFPAGLVAERLAVLLQPLARQPAPSPLVSMELLEVVAAVAVGRSLLAGLTHDAAATLAGLLPVPLAPASHNILMLECMLLAIEGCWVYHPKGLAWVKQPLLLLMLLLLSLMLLLLPDPGARTTEPALQDACLQAAAALGRPLFNLFSHPAPRVADGAAVLMRAIAECGSAAAAPMRDAALREGALLQHLNLALFAAGADSCSCII